MEEVVRIGIYSPNWVGDAVMSLPFIAECRRRFPRDELVVVAKSWVAAVFLNHPFINDIRVLENDDLSGAVSTTRTGRKLRALGLDVFYLLSDSLRCAYLAWLSGCQERVGFRGQSRSPLLTVAVNHSRGNSVHRSVEYLRLLTDPEPESDHGIYLSTDEKNWAEQEMRMLGLGNPIAVFPSSVAPSRKMPTAKWEEILQLAVNSGFRLLFVGSAADGLQGESLAARFDSNAVTSVCGKYTLRQSICLISQCDGAISSDTGLAHVAANLGLKTVSIFGAGDPSSTAPQGERVKVIRENVYCSPCRKNICPNSKEPLLCLTSIDPRKVWETYCDLQSSGYFENP